ncbi:MAG: zinc-binding dehydrogenase [Cytophagales bacterium]|nr:zinc-binding dehydrogenase [Cytophagales bacterium]
MLQIIQNLKTGKTSLEEIPCPQIKKGHVLIKTYRSLVSLGTEKMLVEFGKANLIAKARQQPEKVAMVLDKIKSDGLLPTLETVFKKLEEPLPLGYSNAGEVIEVGEDVSELVPGDRVVSNGPHAEIVCAAKNLVAHIPDNVSYDEACFTVVGSIGLQGIRLVDPQFGETVVVLGLGLIGLITAQLLSSNGCQVIGFDIDQNKVDLALSNGIQAFNSSSSLTLPKGLGREACADAVIITASSKSNDIISQAAQMCRKRGRIVLIGVVGLDINRADFYEKELSFQVSCSYGPGRYEDDYEIKGLDYPLPYVRWTENRNFQTILNAISKGQLNVKSLITEIVDLEEYDKIYSNLSNTKSIAAIIRYKNEAVLKTSFKVRSTKYEVRNRKHEVGNMNTGKQPSLAIVGAGNFTKMTLLPILYKTGAQIKYIVSDGGVSGTHLAKKYSVSMSSTNYDEVLKDKEVDAVMITTRHNLHAEMTIKALQAGKHVFVEKPLVITETELKNVIKALEKSERSVTVGFNRRFAPLVTKAKSLLGSSLGTPACAFGASAGRRPPSPIMNIIINVNAGFIPSDHWIHDISVGGGRIIGEGCHFIDLISFLTASEVKEVVASAIGTDHAENTDNVSIILKYKNGSQGIVNYFANGHKAYAKERIEIYTQGRTLILDNFRKLQGFGLSGFSKKSSKQDKGHKEQFNNYINYLKTGGEPIIPFSEIINTTNAALAAVRSLKTGGWVKIEQ